MDGMMNIDRITRPSCLPAKSVVVTTSILIISHHSLTHYTSSLHMLTSQLEIHACLLSSAHLCLI